MTRHIPGTDPLAPQLYTPAEVADLVERTRAIQTARQSAAVRGWNRRRPVRPLPPHKTSRSSCAVRYTLLVGCSIREAARVFGIGHKTVRGALARLRRDAR